MLSHNPKARPSTEELLEANWAIADSLNKIPTIDAITDKIYSDEEDKWDDYESFFMNNFGYHDAASIKSGCSILQQSYYSNGGQHHGMRFATPK